MCGIAGLYDASGSREAHEATLARMASRMERRGPDAQGVRCEPGGGLAHRRLSIIDLTEAANQPLFDEAGALGIVFNGEIYNYLEIREELERGGAVFRTRSDTEVILEAYRRWGDASFKRLNGMFAFALWDKRGAGPVVTIVRDRFGVKPLFYSLAGGRLAFASELKPLMEVPWISRELSAETVFYFLKFSHVPSPLSIFEGVSQLEPGTWLRLEGGKVTRGAYWDRLEYSRPAGAEPGKRGESEWVDELEQVIERVVTRQIVSDVPVGCFLSGGIDSSLLAMAYVHGSRARSRSRIHTFTIGYAESEFDETPYAAAVAKALGTEHHELKVAAKDFFKLIPDVPTYFDQPFADPTLLSSLLLSRFAREHVTVALSGDGGDELFFGYPYQRALLMLQPVTRIPLGVRSALESPLLMRLAGARGPRLRKAAEILQAKNEAELFQYFTGTIGPMRLDRLASLMARPPSLEKPWFEGMMNGLEGLSWRERIEQVFLRTFMLDTVLAKTDRAGMAYGLEARVPFLDDEMVEFASRVPFGMKYRARSSKHVLRALARRSFPDLIARRPKQGFSIPMREWLRGDLKYLLDQHLSPERLKREGWFNPASVACVVGDHVEGRANHSHLLWSLVSFQMWKERYVP